LTFDRVIDFNIPLQDLLRDIASAGFASPSYLDDKWTVVIDRPRTSVIQHFSPRNINNFQGSLLYPDTPEALRVRFNNQEEGFLEDEFIVYDDGFNSSNTSVYQNVTFPGVVRYENVYKLGRYFLASQKLRPEVFSFEIDVENLVATRGDLCRLSHDAALIGQVSGRISDVDSSAEVIYLDEELGLVSGSRYSLRVRKKSGETVVQNFTSGTTGRVKEVNLGSFLIDSGIESGDLFLFGDEHLESKEVIIRDIEYLDELSARVTCVPYSPEIYNASNVIPDYSSGISNLNDASFRGPPKPRITNIVTDESALIRLESGRLQPRMLVYVSPGSPSVVSQSNTTRAEMYSVRYKLSSDTSWKWLPLVPSYTPFITISPVQSGQQYDVEVRSVDGTGGISNFEVRSGVFIEGGTNPPPDVPKLSVNTVGTTAQLSWIPVTTVDMSHYEIRFTEDIVSPSWQKSTVVADRVSANTTTASLPMRKGVYFIKAVDEFGNKSVNATSNLVTSTLEEVLDVDLVLNVSEHPSWNGVKNNVVVDSGDLVLDSSLDPLPLVGTYDFENLVDLEHVYTFFATSSVKFEQSSLTNTFDSAPSLFDNRPGLFDGDTSLFDLSNVRMQVSTTRDDPNDNPEWTPYEDFTSAEFTCRGMKFRAVLETDDPDIAPKLLEASVKLDMPVSFRSEEDINFTGSTSVVFSSPFWSSSVPAIGLSLTGLGTGDYYNVNSKDHTGFTIEVRDSSGNLKTTPVQMDYLAKGYGKEI
jgi:hypothetical protein